MSLSRNAIYLYEIDPSIKLIRDRNAYLAE